MSSPIYDSIKTLTVEISDAAYKRGHLQARIEMLTALKQVNPSMVAPEHLYAEILNLIGDIQTPAKAPKTRAKKVSA
jgi:predicted component of type VI protein secretion system